MRGRHPPSDRPPLEGGNLTADDAGAGGGTAKDVGDTDTTKAVCSEQSGPKCYYTSVGIKAQDIQWEYVP